jgi:hypothetical protein
MKALINPNENVQYISSWNPPVEPSKMWIPNYTICGERVCQVQEEEFPVAPPLFWMDCADTVTAEAYCYDATNQTIILIPPNEPDPTPQPVTTGTKLA